MAGSGSGTAVTGSKRERRRSGVRWDEHNLTENEHIKAGLQPIKINEPKTPYHGPSAAEESDDGSAHMTPLTLEEDSIQEQSCGQSYVARENGDADRMEQMEMRFSSGELDFNAGASPRHASWEGGAPSSGSYYSSEDEEMKAEKRRRFEERRRKHYQMNAEAREALHRTHVPAAAITGGLDSAEPSRQQPDAAGQQPEANGRPAAVGAGYTADTGSS